MDRYQRVEKAKPESTPIQENEIRITTQGLIRNYISYGISLLQDKRVKEITLKAMGQAISKSVAIAEILKKQVPTLYQDTVISSMSLTDIWEPIEEGLVPVETTRQVSMISITLSTKDLDKTSPGYQTPYQAEEPRSQNQLQQPRQARHLNNSGYDDSYGRGRGRGRGGGRGRGYGDYYADNHGYSNRGQDNEGRGRNVYRGDNYNRDIAYDQGYDQGYDGGYYDQGYGGGYDRRQGGYDRGQHYERGRGGYDRRGNDYERGQGGGNYERGRGGGSYERGRGGNARGRGRSGYDQGHGSYYQGQGSYDQGQRGGYGGQGDGYEHGRGGNRGGYSRGRGRAGGRSRGAGY